MHSDFRKTRIACYTGYVTQAITVNLAPLLFVTFQTKFDVSLGYIADEGAAAFGFPLHRPI